MHTLTDTDMHTHARTHTHAHTFTRTCTHTRMHVNMHIHTHSHTHTHTHTHQLEGGERVGSRWYDGCLYYLIYYVWIFLPLLRYHLRILLFFHPFVFVFSDQFWLLIHIHIFFFTSVVYLILYIYLCFRYDYTKWFFNFQQKKKPYCCNRPYVKKITHSLLFIIFFVIGDCQSGDRVWHSGRFRAEWVNSSVDCYVWDLTNFKEWQSMAWWQVHGRMS